MTKLKQNLGQEILLEEVKRNPYNLQYVENQTEEMCMEAVKRNGYTLKFVKHQTPEICMQAVKGNGFALSYAQYQTEEMCLEAIKNYASAIQWVKQQTPKICMEAAKSDSSNLAHITDLSMIEELEPEILKVGLLTLYVIKLDGEYLFSIGCQKNINKSHLLFKIRQWGGTKPDYSLKELLDLLQTKY